jgi:hypothetical protein
MFNRLVVFGCSLTKDNYIDTWADFVSKDLNLPLCNFAERGAGYDYIVQKIQTTTINDTDLVIIMWPSADRFDLYVNAATPHLLNDIEHASWLDGTRPTFVDYQGNYNCNNGWYINGAVPRGYKHLYYKYFYNQASHVNKAWSLIALTQRYLDSINSNYLMCSSYPISNLIQYHNDGIIDFNYPLYDAINFEKFVKDSRTNGFIDLVSNQQFKFFNPHYPDSDGHRWYVENYIYPKINELL